MLDKLKVFISLSVLYSVFALYQILTKLPASRTGFVIYCILIVIMNRDKAISRNKLASISAVLTLSLLLVAIFLAR